LSATEVDLDRIRVRFATFRVNSAEERAQLGRQLASVAGGEHVLLDTCHRVELVSVEKGPTTDGSQLSGRDAVTRLFEVVAGFDSAVIAEEQLLGQVRTAYEAALAGGSTGPILNELFRRALRFGRAVRSHARPGTDRSLADRGAAWLAARLGDASAPVTIVGTGEMGRLLATRMADRGHPVTLVSASAERGRRVLERLPTGGHRLHVGTITAPILAEVPAVALAVRAPAPILTADLIPTPRPWVLDLSLPSAVDAEASLALADRLMTLDALGTQAGRTPVLEPAVERRLRAEVEQEVDSFAAWLEARRGADALRVLHGEADAVRRRHVARLRGRGSLDDEQLAAVDAVATAMVGELLHGPSVQLRRGGTDAETVRRLFGLG